MTTRLCAYALTLALAAPALAAFGPPVVVTELETGEPGKNGAHGAEGPAPPSAPSAQQVDAFLRPGSEVRQFCVGPGDPN